MDALCCRVLLSRLHSSSFRHCWQIAILQSESKNSEKYEFLGSSCKISYFFLANSSWATFCAAEMIWLHEHKPVELCRFLRLISVIHDFSYSVIYFYISGVVDFQFSYQYSYILASATASVFNTVIGALILLKNKVWLSSSFRIFHFSFQSFK